MASQLRNKVTTASYWSRNMLPYCVFCIILLTSCGLPGLDIVYQQHDPPPTQTVPMVCGTPTIPSSSPEIVQLGLDGEPIYPDTYFKAVLSAVANRIDQHVTINSSPLTVFVNYITHDSLPQNIMSFQVAGIGALPPKPVLQTSTDPYKAARLRKQYHDDLACWQKEVDGLQQEVRLVKAQVRVEIAKMATLSYPYDPISDDMQGFLYDASQHLTSFTGRKFLYIASPLLDNTDVNAVGNLNFSGVAVTVLDFVCRTARVCVSTHTCSPARVC